MLRIALKMLIGDRAKYVGLVLGVAFTAFLVTFAASYLCGILYFGLALILENPAADVWVMDPAVGSVEPTINLPTWALERVRNIPGIAVATPLAMARTEARLPNGAFISVEIIAVDDATLTGLPSLPAGISPIALRTPGSILVDPGGTEGKLRGPARPADLWPKDGPHLDVPMRDLAAGDELSINDHLLRIAGVTSTFPRYPPRPLVYMTRGTAEQVLPFERERTTFILATGVPAIPAPDLAARIVAETGLRARASADFMADTVRWTMENSEDVGDMAAMLAIAACVGLGGTGVLLFMFTTDNARNYGVFAAMGATPRLLTRMVFAQAGLCAVVGTGIGLGACSLAANWAADAGYPVRMMWFNPIAGAVGVLVVSLVAAGVSLRPLIKLQPMDALATR